MNITIEEHDEIALVRMHRDPANALDIAFIDELIDVAQRLHDQSPAAVVLTGSGVFFSGGADLKVVPSLSAEDLAHMARISNDVFARWYALARPVVAAVNGHAVAGGLVLALCADHRVAGTSGRFGLTEVKVGIPYPPSAMAVVQAELAPPAARRLVLRGELADSKAMLELGVVDEIVPDEDVLARALEVAGEMAALPARSFETIKRSLRREARGRAEDRRSEQSLSGWMSSETAEASAAVLRRAGRPFR